MSKRPLLPPWAEAVLTAIAILALVTVVMFMMAVIAGGGA